MSKKADRLEFNRILGRRKEFKRKSILFRADEFPKRSKPLGNIGNCNEGVAGWRSSFYKLPDRVTA